jgi:hypothetical protein
MGFNVMRALWYFIGFLGYLPIVFVTSNRVTSEITTNFTRPWESLGAFQRKYIPILCILFSYQVNNHDRLIHSTIALSLLILS